MVSGECDAPPKRGKRIPSNAKLREKYLKTDILPTIFCPGCGIGIAMNAMLRAFEELQMDLSKVVLVSGTAPDSQEVRAGTDPGDPASVFALKLDLDAQKNLRLKVPTITGLQYTLQRRMALGTGNWEDVASATNFPGDGTVKEFLQTSDGQNYFYRGVIINR